MARKRLSDLLREEAHKPREAEAETPPQANSGKRKRPSAAPEEQAAPNEPATEITIEITAETTTGDTVKGNPVAIAPPNQPTVEELQTKLEQANQREVELSQQVYTLQIELEKQTNRVQTLETDLEKQTKRAQTLETDLEKQANRVQTLETDLGKVGSLKNELEQAKQAAMQLAQENTRLTQEITELQKPQNSPPPTPAPTSTPAALTKVEAMRQQQTRALAHPVFPTSAPAPGHLSDKDLGWVD